MVQTVSQPDSSFVTSVISLTVFYRISLVFKIDPQKLTEEIISFKIFQMVSASSKGNINCLRQLYIQLKLEQ